MDTPVFFVYIVILCLGVWGAIREGIAAIVLTTILLDFGRVSPLVHYIGLGLTPLLVATLIIRLCMSSCAMRTRTKSSARSWTPTIVCLMVYIIGEQLRRGAWFCSSFHGDHEEWTLFPTLLIGFMIGEMCLVANGVFDVIVTLAVFVCVCIMISPWNRGRYINHEAIVAGTLILTSAWLATRNLFVCLSLFATLGCGFLLTFTDLFDRLDYARVAVGGCIVVAQLVILPPPELN